MQASLAWNLGKSARHVLISCCQGLARVGWEKNISEDAYLLSFYGVSRGLPILWLIF